MRNPIACISCRAAKRQCIHNDRPPCKRCKDRVEKCIFPPPGTSSIHRVPRMKQGMSRIDSSSTNKTQHTENTLLENSSSDTSDHKNLGQIDLSPYDLSTTNPYDLFTDEVKNSYLRCAYKWSFHHIPSMLSEVRNNTLDPGVMWSILALAIRFTSNVPPPFRSPLEASTAFAAHARSIILPSIEEPTLSRIQALLMITGHSWGAGEARQAWIYLGMAVRMAQMLGLFEEPTESYDKNRSFSFIEAEERRRTAWTCFLMDNLLSGGKRRVKSLSSHDMQIQLPCDSDSFNFGESVRCEMLDGSIPQNPGLNPVGNLGIVAYSMRVAEIWGKVAKWACSPAVSQELPWESSSQFQEIQKSIARWRQSLPPRLHQSINLLHAHSASNQGQAFAYMHAIALMADMFLHRAYLSHAGTQNKHESQSMLDQQWREWQGRSKRELFEVTEQTCEIFEEIKEFGLYFQRGLVPWNGYTVYTATGIMLYFLHFPLDDDENSMRRVRDHIVKGCAFLKDMKNSWPMADSWRETIKRMQIFYSTIKTKGEHGVSPSERKEMHDAVVDYGALHHSPTNDSNSPAKPVKLEYQRRNSRQTQIYSSPPQPQHIVQQPDPIVIEQPEVLPHMDTQYDFEFTDMDIFNTDFSMDAEIEAAVFSSTQGFWEQFPGEANMVFS